MQEGVRLNEERISWTKNQVYGGSMKRGAFYGRLIDKLMKAGIEPYITTCHMDAGYYLAAAFFVTGR